MVKFLSEKADLALPARGYAQLLVSGDEAQEASTYSIIGKDNIDPKNEWATVHELAHQWWGNLVTCATWKDFWRNEGITVYMTAAWKEHQHGHDAYEAEMDVARNRVAKIRAKGWDRPLAFDGDYPSTGVRRAVQYSKGAFFMVPGGKSGVISSVRLCVSFSGIRCSAFARLIDFPSSAK